MIGIDIHKFAKQLWPLNRSLTGDGTRQTLRMVQKHLPDLKIHEVASGTPVFDWYVPREWNVKTAWVKTPNGKIICKFSDNNLHLVGYSVPVNKVVSLSELQKHLFSIPEMPEAVPYITSYYNEQWGFCISDNQRKKLIEGNYHVCIDAELLDGSLSYGELILEGQTSKEIFLSTYICHPSMANNEISGISVLTFISKYLLELRDRKYSYRIIFIPETIGSITYLSRNIVQMKKSIIAGFNITCIGDDRAYSYLPSREGNTYSDNVARHVLRSIDENFVSYKWIDRGSDERQYCAPMIDLPIASIMRTKYGEYDEYHTSLDDLNSVVTPSGLNGGFEAVFRSIEAIEKNVFPLVKIYAEPQMGRRGLYPLLGNRESGADVRLMMNVISYSDGTKSLLQIAELCEVPIWELYSIITILTKHEIIEILQDKFI